MARRGKKATGNKRQRERDKARKREEKEARRKERKELRERGVDPTEEGSPPQETGPGVDPQMQISKNAVVSIEYELTNDDGQVIDTSKGGAPLSYLHGAGNIVPGLESELEGKASGDAFKVRIRPEDAYGVRDDELVHDVPRSRFPEGDVQPGMQFEASGPAGAQVVTVLEVTGDVVKLDANHPLAGEHLNFDVTVVEVREARPEELQHGHVHGPGGHSH